MKIIDLLNKIVNREEVPETIYYCGLEFEWTGLTYYCEKTDEFLDKHICLEDLEQEVEIIEKHKMPEKLNSEKMSIYEMSLKINEIIDYLEEIE